MEDWRKRPELIAGLHVLLKTFSTFGGAQAMAAKNTNTAPVSIPGVSQADIDRQTALEREAIELGVEKYRATLKKSIEGKRDLTTFTPESHLLKVAIQPMAEALKVTRLEGGSSRFGKIRPLIGLVPEDELAFITARWCLNHLASLEPIQIVALRLGEEVRLHIEYKNLRKASPAHVKAVEARLRAKKSVLPSHRKRAWKQVKDAAGIDAVEWTDDEKFQVGHKLIDLFMSSTGFIRLTELPHKQGHLKVLAGTPEVEAWLKEGHKQCELMSPVLLPMVAPPKPWEGLRGGGYYLPNKHDKIIRSYQRRPLETLKTADLSHMLPALNGLQNTPWRINTFILDVLQGVWDLDGGFAGIPGLAPEPALPPKLWHTDAEFERAKEEEPEAFAAWKAATCKAWEDWHSNRTKRETVRFKLWLGQKFRDEERLYFPWVCDWRGRLYPTPQFVHPQSDDSGKALIEFAEGKPLGARGAYWLMVQGANTFGVDKVSYDDRVKWVKEHEEQIQDCFHNPLNGSRFWTEADDPFKFLAFCREYCGYLEEGEAYVSHLPIALDGSSNGLQHFSALLRDGKGGRAVCLVPNEKPADIYAEVAAAASAIIEADCKAGDEIAQIWRGRVTRKLTKRNTMTTPYGVTAFGRVDQLVEEVKKDGQFSGLDSKMVFPACRYLADVNGRAIAQVVQASKVAMDWLQDVAKVVGGATVWTSPSGFTPHQEYKAKKAKRFITYWGDRRIDLTLSKEEPKDATLKNINGMSPNFIHSLDAAHCVLTINKCLSKGIENFAMIHDSYATHAADTDSMHKLLREAFVEMHSMPLLEMFRDEVQQRTGVELPPVPKLDEAEATLDLDAVQESLYFFS